MRQELAPLPTAPSPAFWYRIGWLLLLTIFLSYLFVAQLLFLLFPTFLLFANAGGQLLGMWLPSLLIIRRLPPSYRQVAYRSPPSDAAFWGWAAVGFGALLALTVALPTVVLLLLPDSVVPWFQQQLQRSLERYQDLMGDASRFSLLLAAAVVPALSEETLFRGIFLNTLRIRHSFWVSITVSAVIFAVVHFDPAHLLELFLLGSYLALLALVSRSLWVPIVFHLLNNGLALLTFASMQPFGSVDPLPIEWWLPLTTGGVAGLSLAVRQLLCWQRHMNIGDAAPLPAVPEPHPPASAPEQEESRQGDGTSGAMAE